MYNIVRQNGEDVQVVIKPDKDTAVVECRDEQSIFIRWLLLPDEFELKATSER